METESAILARKIKETIEAFSDLREMLDSFAVFLSEQNMGQPYTYKYQYGHLKIPSYIKTKLGDTVLTGNIIFNVDLRKTGFDFQTRMVLNVRKKGKKKFRSIFKTYIEFTDVHSFNVGDYLSKFEDRTNLFLFDIAESDIILFEEENS